MGAEEVALGWGAGGGGTLFEVGTQGGDGGAGEGEFVIDGAGLDGQGVGGQGEAAEHDGLTDADAATDGDAGGVADVDVAETDGEVGGEDAAGVGGFDLVAFDELVFDEVAEGCDGGGGIGPLGGDDAVFAVLDVKDDEGEDAAGVDGVAALVGGRGLWRG